MESENGRFDMMDITAPSFGLIVDSAIMSETGSNFGESRVHSFTSVVDNAIRSETVSLFATSPVPSFVSTDDNWERAIPPPLFSPPQIQPATNNFSRDNNNGARNFNIVNTGNRNSGGVAARLFAAPAIALANWRRRKNMAHYSDVPVEAEEDLGVDLGQFQRFSLRQLQVATDNFSKKFILSRGGFGYVYKGHLDDGSVVAIKRLKVEGRPDWELHFKIELEIMGMAEHPNLLRIRGFCITPTEGLLVYPFMVNGSVASCLRERLEHQPPLGWSDRKRIALGSARGIAYLHDHCNRKIIHRDVKAANILLNEDFEAVVGDFGFAKFMDPKDTHVTTIVRGTMGHIAPEYLATGNCSEKTDVFGYGITLLELITGQTILDLARLAHNDDMTLLDWVKGLLRERKLEIMVDADLQKYYNEEEVEQLIQVALLCTQGSPTERPKMSEVVRMLEGDGLAEKWEEWQKDDTFLQDINMNHLFANWFTDSSSFIEASELSGPR